MINFMMIIRCIFRNNDKYKIVDIEKLYYDEVVNFDIDLINDSNLKLAYDAMYGSSMFVAKEFLVMLNFGIVIESIFWQYCS